MTTVDIPRRHLVEETPEGTRWFYPAPVSHDGWGDPHTVGWEDEDGTPLTAFPVGQPHQHKPDWLCSDKPLTAVVQVLRGSDVLEGYRRKPIEELAAHDEFVASVLTSSADMLERFPEFVTPQGVPNREECGCTEDSRCSWHDVFRRAYTKVMATPEPTRVRHELEESVPMPGGMDPAPDRHWYVEDAVAAYYGGTVVHALPGYLVTNPKAIGARLEARLAEMGLGHWTVHAFDHSQGGQFSSKVSCSGPVPWDKPLDLPMAKGRSKAVREFNAAQARKSRVAMTYREEVSVPRTVAGETKAEALAAEAELVETILARLLPDHTTVCSACHGTGFTA